jgi:hypothetical protein
VTGFVASLGAKLAERWLAALVLPGVVFVAAVVVAVRLGHGHWADLGRLGADVNRFAESSAARSTGSVLLIALGVVAGGVAAAALAQALGHAVVRLWTGGWGRLGAPVVRGRRQRWTEAAARHDTALREKARAIRAGEGNPLPDTAALAAARDRIALTEPGLPTWIGDRMRAADIRVRLAYDLDLGSAWPRLWLLLPEDSRTPITEAQTEFTAAARTGAWGTLYLLVGTVWWPAVLIGVGTWVTAWWRARTAMAKLADLVEATVDLHATTLATALGHAPDGPFTQADGETVTRVLRKGG